MCSEIALYRGLLTNKFTSLELLFLQKFNLSTVKLQQVAKIPSEHNALIVTFFFIDFVDLWNIFKLSSPWLAVRCFPNTLDAFQPEN